MIGLLLVRLKPYPFIGVLYFDTDPPLDNVQVTIYIKMTNIILAFLL